MGKQAEFYSIKSKLFFDIFQKSNTYAANNCGYYIYPLLLQRPIVTHCDTMVRGPGAAQVRTSGGHVPRPALLGQEPNFDTTMLFSNIESHKSRVNPL